MNDRTLFRYGPGYRMDEIGQQLDWSAWPGVSGGLQGAIEMCNNNGACRKLKGGVMCPSYRVTRDERDVTRGRANTLRLALSGQLGADALSSDEMRDTMRLCVSCKACKRECPTGVDMAKMKIEVLAARARVHGHSVHDRLVAHLPRYAPIAHTFRGIVNFRNRWPLLARLTESITGFAADRQLPAWSATPFKGSARPSWKAPADGTDTRDVVLLADTFNRWFEPDNLRNARRVLEAAGYCVYVAALPGERKLCCGRTYLATGMLEHARHEAQRMVDALQPWADRGVPIVGLEPSCLLTLRDEYPVLLPGAEVDKLAANTFLLEELIIRDHERGMLAWTLAAPVERVLVHGHCHQKALGAFSAVRQTLALIPDLQIDVIDSGCCGMAGAFGYARETAEVSVRMAELDLLPAVRQADDKTLIVADGTSCRHQIAAGSERNAIHVVELLSRALDAAVSDTAYQHTDNARPSVGESA